MAASSAILFQPSNGIGLGHVSRLAAIALALLQKDENVRVLFGLEGASHVLLEALELPYVIIPTRKRASNLRSRWPEKSVRRMQGRMAEAILSEMKPHLVVFDGTPGWAFARAAIRQNRRVVLCMREVKNLEKYLKSISIIRDATARFLIPCSPQDWWLPEDIQKKAVYTGQISRPLAVRSGSIVVPAFDVVVTGGGGGSPGTVHFYNAAAAAFSLCRKNLPSLTGVMVLGPLFKDWLCLQTAAGMKVLPFHSDIVDLFARCRLVIAQGGYNTIGELIQLDVPAICVPAERVRDDQLKRIQNLIAQEGERFELFQDLQNIPLLSETMLRLLEGQATGQRVIKGFTGASAAAGALLEMLQ